MRGGEQQGDPPLLQLLSVEAEPQADRGERQFDDGGEQDGLSLLIGRRRQHVKPGVDDRAASPLPPPRSRGTENAGRPSSCAGEFDHQDDVEPGPGCVVV